MLEGKKILLVITGGIAAYKSLELIRLLQVNKASVVPVMTKSSQQLSLIHISEPTRPC